MASSKIFENIFVYGTLKRGEPNHQVLTNLENGYAKFLTTGQTQEQFPLILGTRFNIPFLLNAPGKGKYISGEIYHVDDKMIAKLDEFETYPDLYNRKQIVIDSGNFHGLVTCWVYILTKYPEKLLRFPYMNEYHNSPEKPYKERSLRTENVKVIDDLLYQSS